MADPRGTRPNPQPVKPAPGSLLELALQRALG